MLLVEPVIPLRLTPDCNLVIRWNTPSFSYAAARANPLALSPELDSEFGLGNITPQFFFTPAHPGSVCLGPWDATLWLPTATDDTLGINKWGGGPTAVGLWIQGPLLFGFLANQIWAGNQNHGSSATLERIDQLATIEPFVFYNFLGDGSCLSPAHYSRLDRT